MASSESKDKPRNREKNVKESQQATVQYLMKTLANLQEENEILKRDLMKSTRTPSGKIGFILFAIGALALVGSIASTSTVLAFIGLGLTFWGALLLFARPVKFVRGSLLDSTVISSYTTLDRMIGDLNYKGRPVYIPPYPKEAYLPDYLKGLKEMVVFIPAQDIAAVPTIEEIARKQFLLRNPKGMCIAPPGYGLTNLFEKELKAEFSQIELERIYSTLPPIVVNNLELAKQLEINSENGLIHVKIVDSVYVDLYSTEQNLKSVHSIGCPLVSAIACAIAKATGKPTVIKDAVSTDLHTIEASYQTLEV